MTTLSQSLWIGFYTDQDAGFSLVLSVNRIMSHAIAESTSLTVYESMTEVSLVYLVRFSCAQQVYYPLDRPTYSFAPDQC